MNFTGRIKKLQRHLEQLNCRAILVENVIDLYYLTGIQLSVGKLLVHQKGAVLLVDGRYYESCKQKSPCEVRLTPQTSLIDLLTNEKEILTLGIDADETSYHAYQDLQTSMAELASQGRPITLIPLYSPIRLERRLKDENEIEILKDAAELGSEGYDYVLTLLKEGVREEEVAVELEIFWRKRGGRGVAFEPIIAFGANSSMPHHRSGQTKLKPGMTVLIDIGVNYHHYHSDMTRTVFFGKPDSKMVEIHACVYRAQLAALASCKPGIRVGELDQIAREVITEAGYGDFFTHSLGHGVGLEIHEYPFLRNKVPDADVTLLPGMVITIEPGIYVSNLGGVRIEDTVVITHEGHVNLTNRPKEVYCVDVAVKS